MPPPDWMGIVILYYVFGFAAMLVLGTPLLFFYLKLGWTNFLAFIVGGGLCAAITSYAMTPTPQDLGLVLFFTFTGLVSGFVFRLTLFGFQQQLPSVKNKDFPKPIIEKRWSISSAIQATFGITAVAALLFGLYLISELHRSVTKSMRWHCIPMQSTNYSGLPNVESVNLWFAEDPRYEVNVSGPHLCSSLKAAGQPSLTATFDVWGSKLGGLRVYNITGTAVRSKPIKLYGLESGVGFHGDLSSPRSRSPLEVFK